MKKNHYSSLLCCIIMGMTGNMLATHNNQDFYYQQKQQGVSLSIKTLHFSDIKDFHGINPIDSYRVYAKYKALELEIINHSDQDYILTRHAISLPMQDSHKIGKKLQTSRFLLPSFAAAGSYGLLLGVLGFPTVPTIVITAAVAFTALNINVQDRNKQILSNTCHKGIDYFHPLMIESCHTIKKVIFIPKKYFTLPATVALHHSKDPKRNLSFILK